MMLEPKVIVLYVDNLEISQHFYYELLGITYKKNSPTYTTFKLSNGMVIGLKGKYLPTELNIKRNGAVELAFTVDNAAEVEKLFADWQKRKIAILEQPTQVPFGYTFVATDPDGNRLRVIALTD